MGLTRYLNGLRLAPALRMSSRSSVCLTVVNKLGFGDVGNVSVNNLSEVVAKTLGVEPTMRWPIDLKVWVPGCNPSDSPATHSPWFPWINALTPQRVCHVQWILF